MIVMECDSVLHGPGSLAFGLQTPAISGHGARLRRSVGPHFAVMFERERPDPQTDIEFDFFDESPTVEEGGRGGESTPPRRRRKMPTRPPG